MDFPSYERLALQQEQESCSESVFSVVILVAS